MTELERDKKESQRVAYKCGPLIKELFMQIPGLFSSNDLTIYPVENKKDKLLQRLDCERGIDYYIASKSIGETPVSFSWRAVKCKKSLYPNRGVYNAFSIRQKRNKENSEKFCELNKRLNERDKGISGPDYTVQVHYDPTDDSLLSLAVAKTEDVYDAFGKGYYRETNPNNKDKDVWFFDVFWKKMKENGYKVYDWYKDKTCIPTTFLDA